MVQERRTRPLSPPVLLIVLYYCMRIVGNLCEISLHASPLTPARFRDFLPLTPLTLRRHSASWLWSGVRTQLGAAVATT